MRLAPLILAVILYAAKPDVRLWSIWRRKAIYRGGGFAALLILALSLCSCTSTAYWAGTRLDNERAFTTETLGGVHLSDGSTLNDLSAAVDPQTAAIIGAVGTAAGNVVGAAMKTAVKP